MTTIRKPPGSAAAPPRQRSADRPDAGERYGSPQSDGRAGEGRPDPASAEALITEAPSAEALAAEAPVPQASVAQAPVAPPAPEEHKKSLFNVREAAAYGSTLFGLACLVKVYGVARYSGSTTAALISTAP